MRSHTIILPKTRPAHEAARRILVVDDEENIRLLLKECLEQLPGYTVVTAAGGNQALRRCKEKKFDLIITDYVMPGMDGLVLSQQIRQLYPQTVILMLTAYKNEWLSEESARIGVKHILDKPVKLLEIRRIVIDILAQNKPKLEP